MHRIDPTEAAWFKSSYSNGQSACVEIAFVGSEIVPVRDSKAPNGPALAFRPNGWSSFVRAVKGGHLSA
ncbi:DUF397 domain-containing protein [Streptomyces sp. NPDC056716]|uniref:DUF397 domain-containing protein n=1 Tax=unclassified Streptomyces TaxID=2593676 RepID=UPI0036A3F06A